MLIRREDDVFFDNLEAIFIFGDDFSVLLLLLLFTSQSTDFSLSCFLLSLFFLFEVFFLVMLTTLICAPLDPLLSSLSVLFSVLLYCTMFACVKVSTRDTVLNF